MTKISRRHKIASWEKVKENILEMIESVPDHTAALSLPYGMQGLYDITHPEPVRILLHPNMNEYDTFLTHYGKAKKFYLNLWTVSQRENCPEKKILKIKLNYQLKHIVYVPLHRCFVAFAMDLTLRVYSTINFIEMSRTETNHSILCLYYNACRDDVLTGCLGFVMIWKFPQAQSDSMFPSQKIECPAIDPDYWIIWIKVDKSSHQLLLNCEEAIIILDEKNYKLKYNFKIDFRHSLPFTACAFYHPSCYFITGSKDYSIKVWNTSLNQCPLVTSFSGHCNVITSLEIDVPHHLLISSSTDKTIRLWCLETFAQTYVLETGEEVHHMELMTSGKLFYLSHEHIRVWNLNHFHTLFTVLGFEIVTSRRVVSGGFPTRLLLQGKDGAIRIVSPSDGTIITTMFPLETLPESIVDYAYNPREDKLYVVLSSGSILVFNTRTNPCSTYQLWKPEVLDEERVTSISLADTYGVSCVAMMNIDETSELTENEINHYTLLFAGLNNGHISLVYSNELSMHDTIEAHYGKIALLRVSQGLDPDHYSSLLVSCGTDCELKVWKVVFRNCSAKIISLELWSYIKLLSIPHDMETIGYTIGLVMDNNTLVTCRVVNHDAERPVKSRQSHRDSISRSGLYDIECITSTAEESHSKTITGLSACPTLGLFATSSDDWSVKIWNTKAKLLKEICFAESLRGVCFANTRGDLLVGFQSHISIVPLTNYLPLKILKMLSKMDFPDDIFEHHLPFDRMLAFSYDPLRTPCLPLDLEQRRLILLEEEYCIKTALTIPSVLFQLDHLPDECQDDEETEPPPRRYSTTQEQHELDEKIRKFQRSSMSRRSSALQSPLLEEVIARITQSFSSRSEITATKIELSSCDLVEQLRRLFNNDDTKIPDDYWPCAPDGFIPNSVVRLKVPPKELPAHLIPRLLRGEEAKEWIKKTKKKSPKDDMGMPEDCYYPVTFDDDDDIGFFSIFDGYNEASFEMEKISLLVDSSEEESEKEDDDQEGLGSSDEEDLKKKWKASTKTTMNKEQMLTNIRARQAVREKKKVSKKPEMLMIIAAEEEEENDDETEGEFDKARETQSLHHSTEEEDPNITLPPILRHVIDQPWFPQQSLTDGITVEDVFQEMISLMADCAPLTYGKICDELVTLISCVGISDDQKTKMLNVVIDNLHHPSAGIRRASLKTVQELRVTSNKAVEGIVSCLVEGSQELQGDALNALEHLFGIKDKEALRDLFIKINILSRSPTPEEDILPPLHRLQTHSKGRTDFVVIDGEDGVLNKRKYVREWLVEDKSPETTEKTENHPNRSKSFKTESLKVKMASSIVSKIKLYKPKPRLSIVDLTFHDSPISSGAISEPEEIASPTIGSTDELMRKLQQTKAGCKLLSRLGKGRTLGDDPNDPMLNFGVLKKEEQVKKNIETKSKIEKRPPSALTGFAYGRAERPLERYQRISSEFEREYERQESIDQDMDRLPDIQLSQVSSMTKKSDIQEDINKLVLPKIFNKIKSNRRNSTLAAISLRNGRCIKQQDFAKLSVSEFKDIITEQEKENVCSIEDEKKDESPDFKPDEMFDTAQHEKQKKTARRLTLVEKPTTIDCKRRKAILKELKQRRLEDELRNSQLLANQERPVLMTSSLDVESASEDEVLLPACKNTIEQSMSEVHLPKLDISHKQHKTTVRGDSVSHDITNEVLSTDRTSRAVQSGNVPYSIYSDVASERLSNGTSMMTKRPPLRDVRIANETLRVLPVNPKLTIDTGCNNRGRSRYGVLEVFWTSRDVYNTQDLKGTTVVNTHQKKNNEVNKENKKRCVPNKPVEVKKILKPITNRNLVTNPYTLDTQLYFTKKLQKLPCISEGVSSVSSSSSNSDSSRESVEPERGCTVREILDFDYCFSRSI